MIRRLILLPILVLTVVASACSDDNSCAIDSDCFAGEVCRGDVCEKGERGDMTGATNNDTTNNDTSNNIPGTNSTTNNTPGTNNTNNIPGTNGTTNNTAGTNNTNNANNVDPRTLVDLAAGEVFTCALDSDSQLWCWGRNSDNQLSIDASIETATRPQLVTGIDNVTAIAAARQHRCALRGDRTVWCWGRDYGITGGPSASVISTPTEMPISDIVQVEMGGYSACALESDRRSLSCWGSTDAGNPPAFDEDIRDFAVGDDHSCAVLASGAVRCWGSNYYDAVATGDPVQGIEGATQIAAGERHTCAIADGDVYCWGWNDEGQCGRPPVDFQEKFEMPQKVEGVSDATEIYAGSTYSCALHDSDRLTCWGGLLGHDSSVYTDHLIVGPTQLFGLGRGVTGATAGFIHGCAAKGADLYCWGDNSDRQLAQDGSKFRYEDPVRVQFPD